MCGRPLLPSYSWSSFLGGITGTPEDGSVTSQFDIDPPLPNGNFYPRSQAVRWGRGGEGGEGLIKRRGAQSASVSCSTVFISLHSNGSARDAGIANVFVSCAKFIPSFPSPRTVRRELLPEKFSARKVVRSLRHCYVSCRNFVSYLTSTSDASRYIVSPMVVLFPWRTGCAQFYLLFR